MNKRTLTLCLGVHKDICLAEWNAFLPNAPVISSFTVRRSSSCRRKRFRMVISLLRRGHPGRGNFGRSFGYRTSVERRDESRVMAAAFVLCHRRLLTEVGQLRGFSDGHLLYWLRFLNVFFLAALVWLSFLTARELFPQKKWLALCVPVLVAFIPVTSLKRAIQSRDDSTVND